MIVSKVAELMVRTEVFVLRRKCIQTGQKCVRCISKIFFLPTKCWAVYIESTQFCWVTTAGQISRSLPKRMHKSNSTVHESASQTLNSPRLAAGWRWMRHGFRAKGGFRLTHASDCTELTVICPEPRCHVLWNNINGYVNTSRQTLWCNRSLVIFMLKMKTKHNPICQIKGTTWWTSAWQGGSCDHFKQLVMVCVKQRALVRNKKWMPRCRHSSKLSAI